MQHMVIQASRIWHVCTPRSDIVRTFIGLRSEAAAPHLAAVAKCLSDMDPFGGFMVRAAACEALGKHGEALGRENCYNSVKS